MTEGPAAKGSTSDWLSDRILRGLIGTALALPWDRRLRLMGAAARRVVGPLAGYRRRALTHLALLYPEMSAARRRALAAEVLDNFGRTLIENYSGPEFAERLADAKVTGTGLAALAEAQARGRPVIFFTGHFGNHEAPRHVLHRLGYQVGGLYRPMRNPFFNSHYVQTLAAVSGPVFPRGRRGTTGFVRLLKTGGMVTILFDVHDGHGVAMNFLGRPALTATTLAELALRYDAVVIPYFGIRQPDGTSFEVAFEAPIPHGPPLDMMRAATDRLEARIAAHPGQWFWIHRRWKTDRPAIA